MKKTVIEEEARKLLENKPDIARMIDDAFLFDLFDYVVDDRECYYHFNGYVTGIADVLDIPKKLIWQIVFAFEAAIDI